MDYFEIFILCVTVLTVMLDILILIFVRGNKKIAGDRIVSELRLDMNRNNMEIMNAVMGKISESEQKQMEALMGGRMDTAERLELNIAKMTETFVSFQDTTAKYINESNIKLTESLSNNFASLNRRIDENLDRINNRVDERLNQGFEKTNKTFEDILERLSKIDEAQKKIDSLSGNIVSLQDILTDKKSRGTFGEVQLNHILSSIFGENNERIFELQKKLSNGTIVDAVLHMPSPVGMLCIDSKFPLENYRRMVDRSLPELERMRYEKDFKANVKKHVNDISSKYIIEGETAAQAVMFVPAEAVFAEINAYHQDVIDYASSLKVWITSPTTLMSVMSTVQIMLRNMEREKYTSLIHEELNKLGAEFKRYKVRWDSLSRDIKRVSEDVETINITSSKIEKKFDNISKVELEDKIFLE